MPPSAGEPVPVGTKTCRLIFLFTYGVVLAVAEQGRSAKAAGLLAETLARHPKFNQAWIRDYWVAPDPRFIAGRDRLIAVAAGLGLAP